MAVVEPYTNSFYILFPAKGIVNYRQFISRRLYDRLKRTCSLAGRALLYRAVESEGFSTWGVGVVENFNDSGETFCSPIMTVCATNVRKRHTYQFQQLDASTRDDHGYSDRPLRTNLHTFTQGPFQISSVPWAHHATYTLWMQPFGACITEISFCSFWLALSLLRDVGYATMNESSHGSSSIVT